MSNRPNYDPSSLDSDFAGFQQIIKNYLKLNVFTASIVEITAVNGNKVDVKPVIKQLTTNGEAIEMTSDDVTHNIPIMMMFGGQKQISFGVAVGDKGLLMACKEDYSNFIESRVESEIASNRLFNLSNGFYLPFDFQSVSDSIIVRNTNSQIEITDLSVKITNANGEINIDIDNLIQIKNTAKSLYTILNTLLTTLISLKTGLTPATPTQVIDSVTSASLATLQTDLALLLKA